MKDDRIDPDPGGGSSDGVSRRSLLGKIGVGGAIAWVAPTLVSTPAFAQGTCINCDALWADWKASLSTLDPTPFTVPLTANAQVDLSFSTANMGGGTATVGPPTAPPLGGNGDPFSGPGGYIELRLDTATAQGQYSEITFDFIDSNTLLPVQVENLTFTLLDIDQALPGWIDRVTLFAFDSTTATYYPATFNFVTAGYVSHTSVVNGDQFDGLLVNLGGVDPTSADANVLINYPDPITQLVVRYEADGTGALDQLQAQQVGITDFSLCSFA